MTLKFQHNKADIPSSLILDMTVWNDFGESFPEKGKIDTGASHTVIPDHIVNTLNLKKIDEITIRTATGMTSNHYKYSVSIEIASIKFERLEVIAMPKECGSVGPRSD